MFVDELHLLTKVHRRISFWSRIIIIIIIIIILLLLLLNSYVLG